MIVYLITATTNGKAYVGQSSFTLFKRWENHKRCARHGRQTPLYHAIRKYGVQAFAIRVLAESDSKQEIDYLEKKFIQDFGTKVPNGYNLSDGGDGAPGYRHTPETKELLRKLRIGKSSWMKGRTPTPRMRASVAEANKKRVWTDESRAKVGIASKGNKVNLGRIASDEARKKMSATRTGQKRGPYRRRGT
jgi:group I intron endonuclease